MILEYIYLLNVVMISRMMYLFSDRYLSRKQWVVSLFILILGMLVFEVNGMFCVLLTFLIIDCFVVNQIEKIKKFENASDFIRLINFIIIILVSSFFFSERNSIHFNNQIRSIFYSIDQLTVFSFLYSKYRIEKLIIDIFGLLLVSNEMNIVLRTIFSLLGLVINKRSTEEGVPIININNGDYKSGRIVGILERVLMYIFIINGNISSIAFILTAKSIVRFKELNDKSFAEYFLVGTLLSSLLAIVVSNLTLYLN